MRKFFLTNKKRIMVSGVVSLILTMTTVFGYQIEHFSELSISMPVFALMIFLFAFIAVLLFFLYKLFDKAKTGYSKTKDIPSRKVFSITLSCLFMIYTFQLLALFPGLFIFDAPAEYAMYVNDLVSEHHTALHTVILGFIVEKVYLITGRFNAGVAAYTFFLYVIYSLSMSYIVTYVYKKVRRIWVLVTMILFLGFYPPLVLQVMSTTKDTLFFIFLLLSITLTVELVEDVEGFVRRPVKAALWVFSFVLSVIFRNNCIYAVPFFVVALFICVKKKKQVLGIFSAAVLLFVLYRAFFIPAFVTEEVDGREMLSVPAQQLLRIYSSEGADIRSDEIDTIENLFSEAGRLYWTPRIADYSKGSIDMTYYREHFSELKDMYFSLVLRNPKLSFEAFLENSCGFWYPGCELTLYPDGTKGYWRLVCYPFAYTDSKIKPVYDFYTLFDSSDFVTKNPVTSLLFSPGMFFYIFLIMFAYAIDKNKKTYIPSFIFVFALWLTYLLGPVALVRYAIYLFAMIPLYFSLVLSEDEKRMPVCIENKEKEVTA